MASITRDLGVVTAYGYALEGGYTGTEEEFSELMADIVNGVRSITYDDGAVIISTRSQSNET